MLQYKIPQNVGIEDKIVGPFSLRQLIILAIGIGISYVLFAITSKLYELNVLEYILIVLPALFALAMAMLKIHNVSFGKYILLMLEFAIKPKRRMWDHRGISALVAPDLTDKAAAKKKVVTEEKGRKDVNLGDLSAMLDSGGFEHVEKVKHEDIDEVTDDDLITEAYFGNKKEESSTENMYWRTRDMQKKKLNLLAKMQPVAVTVKTTPVPAPSQPTIASEPPPTSAPPTPAPTTPAPTPEAEKKESVTEHLANVIKEARQNNQAKKVEEPTPPPAQTSAPAPAKPVTAEKPVVAKAIPSEDQAEAPKKKRKRRRRRKPKTQAGPIRQDTQINTTSKSEPVKLIKKTDHQEGETSFDDLSKGDEIEINLD